MFHKKIGTREKETNNLIITFGKISLRKIHGVDKDIKKEFI